MAKTRHIIVSIAAIIYITLFFMKIEIPRNIFITLLSIVLISKVIDEWNLYKETKKKIHLAIPLTFLIGIVFIGLYLLIR